MLDIQPGVIYMSRSTRKPYFKDSTPGAKRQANKRVRKSKKGEELADGGSYKKEYCSYDISDYSFHAPENKKAGRK